MMTSKRRKKNRPPGSPKPRNPTSSSSKKYKTKNKLINLIQGDPVSSSRKKFTAYRLWILRVGGQCNGTNSWPWKYPKTKHFTHDFNESRKSSRRSIGREGGKNISFSIINPGKEKIIVSTWTTILSTSMSFFSTTGTS